MAQGITVADLVEFLKTQPQDVKIAFRCYSEFQDDIIQCLLELENIKLHDLCQPRPDGWIQNKRPDMETEMYLVFPGN